MADRQDSPVDDFFSAVSKKDLKGMGLGDVAYLRRYVVSGHLVFVLHAADGSALEIQDSQRAIKDNASLYELDLVTVH